MKRMMIALLALAVVGCDEVTGPDRSAGPVDPHRMLSTDEASYAPGSEAVLILTNHADDPIGYNLCLSILEVRVDDEWESTGIEAGENCTVELAVLEPGASTSFAAWLPSRLEAGEYRFRTTIEEMDTGQREDVVSNGFTVSP